MANEPQEPLDDRGRQVARVDGPPHMAGSGQPSRDDGDQAPGLAALSRALTLALVLSTAGLVMLALPTFELAPVALVAWAPLLYALHPQRALTRRQRLLYGWLCGFTFQLVLFRWIPFTLTEMTSLPGAVTWVMCVLYAAWHGLQTALFLAALPAATRFIAGRYPALLPVAIAAFYALVEWLFPALFPWSYGHGVWEVGPIATPLLSLQGVPLLTLWVLLPSALVADLLARPALRRRVLLATGLALALPLLIGASLRAALLDEQGRTLSVAIVQPNYTLAEKKKANVPMRMRLLDRLEDQLATLPRGRFDLVVSSEGAFPLWWRLDADSPDSRGAHLEATRRLQRAIADGPAAPTIMGGLRLDEVGGSRNSAVHLGADGRILGHYDKRTLVPFSEYIPFSDWFPALKEIRGIGHMTPGEAPCLFREGLPVPVTCGICYESMFAGDTRAAAADARLLVNLTIDTWFGTSTAPRMHLMSHASRAAELGIPLLRAGLTGISAVIGADGQVQAALPLDTAGVLTAEVALTTGTTVYRAVGQVLMPLMGLSLLVLIFLRVTKRLRARVRHASGVGA